MLALMSWLFHRGRTREGSGEDFGRSRPLPGEETAQEWRVPSSTIEGRTTRGDAHVLEGSLFVDFEALAERLSALLEGLTLVPERAALISFVGTGITDPSRYEDAAGAFNQLRHMAPADEGALIQVFRQQLREESKGDDFLFVHFAGDPLSVGCLICALTGGGLMAGWRLG